MVSGDVVLWLMAWLGVLDFAIAATYKYRRSSISYNPLDEVSVHLIAMVVPFAVLIASLKFGKPMFTILGLAMITIMSIYYAFSAYVNGQTRSNWALDTTFILTMLIAVGFATYYAM